MKQLASMDGEIDIIEDPKLAERLSTKKLDEEEAVQAEIIKKYNKRFIRDLKFCRPTGSDSVAKRISNWSERRKEEFNLDKVRSQKAQHQHDIVLENMRISPKLKPLKNVLVACRNIIKESNQACMRSHLRKQEKLKHEITKLENNRWQHFKERRAETVIKYIECIKRKRFIEAMVRLAALSLCVKRFAQNIVDLKLHRRRKLQALFLGFKLVSRTKTLMKQHNGIHNCLKHQVRHSLLFISMVQSASHWAVVQQASHQRSAIFKKLAEKYSAEDGQPVSGKREMERRIRLQLTREVEEIYQVLSTSGPYRLILLFLRQAHQKYQNERSIRALADFHLRIRIIQDRVKCHHRARMAKLELFKVKTKRTIFKLIQHASQNNDPALKELGTRFLATPSEVQDYVASAYVDACEFKYSIAFFEWRLRNKIQDPAHRQKLQDLINLRNFYLESYKTEYESRKRDLYKNSPAYKQQKALHLPRSKLELLS